MNEITHYMEACSRLLREKDAAYAERDQLVRALTMLFPSWLGLDNKEPEWPVVYVQLPTGQVSWHIPKDHLGWFVHLGDVGDSWDGHDTIEKYRRLGCLEQQW